MKTENVMNTPGNIPNWDISEQDITARKRKMEHPVVEIIPLAVADVVVESPGYEMKETDDLG